MNVPMTTTLCKRFPQPETVNHTKDLSPFVVADAPFEKSPGFLVSLGMTRRGGAFSLKSEVGIVLESLFTSLAWILHFVQDDESGRGFQGNRIRPSPPKPKPGHHSEHLSIYFIDEATRAYFEEHMDGSGDKKETEKRDLAGGGGDG